MTTIDPMPGIIPTPPDDLGTMVAFRVRDCEYDGELLCKYLASLTFWGVPATEVIDADMARQAAYIAGVAHRQAEAVVKALEEIADGFKQLADEDASR